MPSIVLDFALDATPCYSYLSVGRCNILKTARNGALRTLRRLCDHCGKDSIFYRKGRKDLRKGRKEQNVHFLAV
jgi:hypothetical protein